MKLLFLLSFFLGSLFLAQTFSFDYFIETQTQQPKNKNNPKNQAYFFNATTGNILEILPTTNGETYATLRDYNALQIHHFVVEKKDGQDVFTYLYTNKFLNRSPLESPLLEIEKVDNTHFETKIFADGNRKKPQMHTKIVLEESPENILFVDFPVKTYVKTMDALQQKIQEGKRFSVKEVTIQYGKNAIWKTTVLSYRKAALQIHISQLVIR